MINKGKEMIERNIELSAEFSRYLFEHPEVETNAGVKYAEAFMVLKEIW